MAKVFGREGINIRLNARVTKVGAHGSKKALHLAADGREETIEAEELLVGVGRVPNIEGIDLEAAGVDCDPRTGIKVDRYLRSTNKRVYAAGDVCFPYKFTHMAEATARIALQNALFVPSKKTNSLIIPWCTYTDPEIAHIGLSPEVVRKGGSKIRTFHRALEETDRAIVDGEEEGFVKIHIRKGSDKILGATVIARHASEMISEITALMAAGKGLRFLQMAVIHPYPTQSDAIKRASAPHFEGLLTPRLKRLLARWFTWKR
jgi:pyruvate/2-oxoglutarate dehydrogenase complex dihydrolipoamide dehydrogenase (E3) component